MAKRILGIVLIILSAVLLFAVIHSIAANLPQEGPMKGNIRAYIPPYKGHGLLMIAGGIGAVISFLLGGVMLSLGKMDQ